LGSLIESFGAQSHDVTGYFILAILFLGIAGYFQRVSASGHKAYSKMREPTEPSLKAGPSAFDRTLSGTGGCLQFMICAVLFVVFLVLAFDAAFNECQGLQAFFARF
jgi:hypothetical protein